MKLTVKRSLGKFGQYNIRLPIPLKQRLEKTRARAEELGVDFAATQLDNLDQFETELAARLEEEGKRSGLRGVNALRTNGSASDHA